MLYPQLSTKRIILASKSPRRLELVRGLEIEPEVVIREVDESFPDSVVGPEVAKHVTLKKASAFNDILTDNDVLITGDTVVLLGDDVLEKPVDREEAIAMPQRRLSQTFRIRGLRFAAKCEGITTQAPTLLELEML